MKKTSAEEQEEIEIQMKDLSDTEVKLRKMEQNLAADYMKLRAEQGKDIRECCSPLIRTT